MSELSELKEILYGEIEAFRQQGYKFLNGEMSKMDFKAASGKMGVYAHRNATDFMIRLRTPSGVIELDKLRYIYETARKYNLTQIHPTTRQAVQLHGLNIDEICEIMKDAIGNDLFSRGAGGNFPRNVALSPQSGVDPEEAFDATPYALAVNDFFIKKITTYKLPRKFKVSFSSSSRDTGHATIADLGFISVKDNGKDYFRVYIGGGLGRNAKLAVDIGTLIEPKDVLYHVEAITNLFIAEGDYENKHKARLRYVHDRMGSEGFIKCYLEHLDAVVKAGGLDLFVTPKIYKKEGKVTTVKNQRLHPQKQKGLYSVYFHPIGGQLQLDALKILLDELETIEEGEVRLDMSEGLWVRNLTGPEARKILQLTAGLGGDNRLEQSTACIGVPTCQMGATESQSVLAEIIEYFRAKNFKKDVLPKINISGCPNSCGTHEIGEIGFIGKIKKIDNISKSVFELHLGGLLLDGESKLAVEKGEIIQEQVPEFLYEIATTVDAAGIDYYDWINNKQEELNAIIKKYTV